MFGGEFSINLEDPTGSAPELKPSILGGDN